MKDKALTQVQVGKLVGMYNYAQNLLKENLETRKEIEGTINDILAELQRFNVTEDMVIEMLNHNSILSES